MGRWPVALAGRETGGRGLEVAPPRPNAGVLVLDEAHQALAALPGGVLGQVEGPLHYLDLGGVQAPSLAAFGGVTLLTGVTKLYACHSGLTSLAGLERLASIRWLYLDRNALSAQELLRLPEVLPAGVRLEALDVSGNPGCTPEVEAALQSSGLLRHAEYFNGARLRRL
ncbi:leucine rich repeat [Micractinium conductrix]|uniref:Leucine rich repeat n=1 Tax=Micractinium conductrix TaxID=554055 RepID=A0A2P6VRF3_9CHLO|nr:leucine rich repeat [Micractinium conductrix]|eukprot:PSC76662.1 leucine rich repeat [Micractinium conductrix]